MYITMYAYTHIYTQVTSERVDQAKGILTRTLTLLSVRPSRTVAGIISQKMALPLIYSKFSCKLIFGRNRTDAVSGDAEAQRKAALDDMQASRCRYHITHCNTLLRIATHCNTLQHTATHQIQPPHSAPSSRPRDFSLTLWQIDCTQNMCRIWESRLEAVSTEYFRVVPSTNACVLDTEEKV